MREAYSQMIFFPHNKAAILSVRIMVSIMYQSVTTYCKSFYDTTSCVCNQKDLFVAYVSCCQNGRFCVDQRCLTESFQILARPSSCPYGTGRGTIILHSSLIWWSNKQLLLDVLENQASLFAIDHFGTFVQTGPSGRKGKFHKVVYKLRQFRSFLRPQDCYEQCFNNNNTFYIVRDQEFRGELESQTHISSKSYVKMESELFKWDKT